MGMFDYFLSSYNLGEQFTEVECQTKDIEDIFGGTMTKYWLDPSGCLYMLDYAKTHYMKKLDQSDDDYSSKLPFINYKWVKTGTNGRVSPVYITKYITVYPSHFNGDWVDWPQVRLHFKQGKLIDYENFTKTSILESDLRK
ncbi:MAG: hypothetical protein ACO4CS_03855 [bacterium]